MRSLQRRLVPFITLVAVGLMAITCTDAPIAPGPNAGRRATLSFSPVFSSAARQAAALYDESGLDLDHVRIIVTRTPADTLKDTTITIVTGQADLVLDLSVQAVPGEQLTGELQFLAGSTLLYAGSGPLIVHAIGQSGGTPSVILVAPVGPGATAASVTVTPASGLYPISAPVTLTAHAYAADESEIANAIFGWSVSDTTIATVTVAGVVKPTAKTGSVQVTATTLNGTSGSATITFVAPAAAIVAVSGGDQSGLVGAALPLPLVVKVQSATGGPVAGQTVIFGTSGGASASPSTAVSDSTGLAKATLTLGSTAGTYGFVATTGAFSVTATETANAGAASAITAVSGGGQSDTVQKALKNPLVVKVTDALGNAKSGVTVTWTRTAGDGALSAPTSTTDASGQASVNYTLGKTAGAATISAGVDGVTAVATFSETAVPGFATITILSGNGQTGEARAVLAKPLVIQAIDSSSNLAAGVPVVWTVQSGSAQFESSQAATGTDGHASATVLLGSAAGPVVITAAAGTQSVTFNETVLAGSPSTLTLSSGSGQSAQAGTALPAFLVARVMDGQGNPVQGLVVTFAVATGGGTLSAATPATDATGSASTTWTLGPTAGTQTVTASVTGLTGSPLTFSATATAPPAATLAFQVGATTVTAGSIISPAVTVRALDGTGNLSSAFTGNVTLALAANPGQATLGGTLTRPAVGGVATFSDLTVSAVGNGYTLQATSTGLTSATGGSFNVTQSSPLRTWTGAVSTDWNAAGNWSGGVPGASNSVQIPAGTPNSPTLTSGVNLTDVTVANGATLSLGAYNINSTGSVNGGSGPGITGSGFVTMSGTGVTLRGTVSSVYVTGSTTISGATTMSGPLSVSGGTLTFGDAATLSTSIFAISSGRATVGPGVTVAAGALTVVGTGSFLSQTGGAINVSGQAIFNGDNTTGLLTGGTLTIGGNFVQGQGTSAPLGFVASGTHRVIFNGSGSHSVYFGNPTSSHFENLEIDGPGSVALTTAVVANGQLISTTGASPITGNGNTLSVAGLDVDGMTFDNTSLVSTGGTIARFDNVTFQNYSPSQPALTITHPGAATPFTFNNTQFLVTPTEGGAYIVAADNNSDDGHVLTIALVNSTPADGRAHTVTSGGAVVNWPGANTGVMSWTNAAGGSWSTASNWSLNRVPVTADSVVIALPGTYTVTLDTTFTASAITVGAAGGSGTQTLSLSGRTLTVGSALRINSSGTVTTANAVISGGGTIINQGTLGLKFSTVNTSLVNQGAVIANDNNSVVGSLAAIAASTIRVQSDGGTGTAVLTVANGFTNHGTVELTSTVSGYSATLAVSSGTLTNASDGTINALPGTGGTRELAAVINNQGRITATSPLTFTNGGGQSTNSGTIDATNADLTLSQSGASPTLTNTGTITIGTGHIWTINGGAFSLASNATLSGGGAVAVNNAAATFGSPFSLGALGFNGSTGTFQVDVSTTGMPLAFANSTINGPGTITNVAGQTMTLKFSTIAASAAVINQGTIVADDDNTIASTLTAPALSTIRVQSDGGTGTAVMTIVNGFTNHGTVELTSTVSSYSATLAVSNGTFTNASDGAINALPGTGGARTLSALFDNEGAITASAPLTLSTTSGASTNAGTINASGADLTLSQSGTSPTTSNTGTITIASGRTWTIAGGTFTQQSGATLNGGGALVANNATVTFGTSFALSALTLNATTATFQANLSTGVSTFAATNSTINGPGTITNVAGKTMTLKFSTIAASATVINQGTIVGNDNNTIAGTLTAAALSTIRVQSDGGTGTAVLTVASGFTNHGTVELTSTVSGYSATLAVSSGTLTNASDGAINALPGTGGARTLAALFDNEGTITANAPLTFANPTGTSTNNATINATNADLALTQSGAAPALTNNGEITIGGGHTWTIDGGTFTLSSDGALDGNGAVVVNNSATANFSNSFTLSALTVNSSTANFQTNVSTDGLALTLSSATVGGSATITNVVDQTMTTKFSTFASTIALDNQGTLNALDNNTFSGNLRTSQSSDIRVESDGGSGNATLTVNGGNGFTNNGTIDLTSTVSTYGATLAASVALINSEGGTINSLAGTGGTRSLTGPVSNSGTINIVPNAAGLLTIQGNLSTTGIINLELGGLTASTQYDRLAITGTAALSGTLNVSLINGFNPVYGNPFTLLTYQGVSGNFGAVNLPYGSPNWHVPSPPSGSTYTVTYAPP